MPCLSSTSLSAPERYGRGGPYARFARGGPVYSHPVRRCAPRVPMARALYSPRPPAACKRGAKSGARPSAASPRYVYRAPGMYPGPYLSLFGSRCCRGSGPVFGLVCPADVTRGFVEGLGGKAALTEEEVGFSVEKFLFFVSLLAQFSVQFCTREGRKLRDFASRGCSEVDFCEVLVRFSAWSS